MYYFLHKSVQFNQKYSLLREVSKFVVEHLKKGGMILFLNICKGGLTEILGEGVRLIYHNELW